MKTKICITAVVFGLIGLIWLCIAQTMVRVKNVSQHIITAPSNGKQTAVVTVKQGYQPREIMAKAGVPLLLTLKTQGDFDCTSVFLIPKLNVRQQLPSTGETVIEIPAQKAGDSVRGVCGMGMYSLVINYS